MKKFHVPVIPLFLSLYLTGCTAGISGQTQEPAAEKPQNVTVETTAAVDQTPETEAKEPSLPGQNPAAGTDDAKKDAEQSGENTVVYEQGEVYLSLVLPDGWDYQIKTAADMEPGTDLMTCAIDFWPVTSPEAVFQLGYCPQFGICGTDLTSRELSWNSGLSGRMYTTEQWSEEDFLWLTVVFDLPENRTGNPAGSDTNTHHDGADGDSSGSHAKGTYVILASPRLSVWEEIGPRFEQILDSVMVGQER